MSEEWEGVREGKEARKGRSEGRSEGEKEIYGGTLYGRDGMGLKSLYISENKSKSRLIVLGRVRP